MVNREAYVGQSAASYPQLGAAERIQDARSAAGQRSQAPDDTQE